MEKLYSRCLRCGRKLKKLEYRKAGYGKVCAEKVKKENNTKRLF